MVYGIGTASLTWWTTDALPFVMAGIGAAAAVMFVPSLLLTTELAPGSVRSTALGGFNSAGSLGFVVGPVAGGAISQLVAARADWLAGYRAAFAVAGASELLCVAIAVPLMLRLRRNGARF